MGQQKTQKPRNGMQFLWHAEFQKGLTWKKKKKYQMNIWSWPFYNYVLSRRIERQFWKFNESFVLTLFIVTHYVAASIYCYCNGNNFIIFNSESELHM